MFVRLLLASALAVSLASAQRGGGGGGGDMGGGEGGMGGGMPRAQRQSKLDMVADKLHLSKEQKEQAAKIFADAMQEASPINEQIKQGRNVITSAILDGKTGDDLNKMMAQYTDLLTQKAAVEAKAYAKIYAILDAKQQAKAAPVFADQMDGMFDGGGGGRRAGGARGGEPR
jgi:Spy/CpxP family protein refolding chaperone